ncbi:MAG: TMEM175 family protein [Ilumatobacteraceae bacterium]|nr:TMEM175 family protein [Ilumatobacteraceae bacterium]
MIRRPQLRPSGGDDGDDVARNLRTARMEAFSDGVFAIAITLLVLEISLPEDESIGHGLLTLWPSYVAYVTSFLTIGGVWLSHTLITEYLSSADAILLRLNLALLLMVSFLPFPSRLLAESMNDTEDARIVAPFYGLVLLALGILVSAMWRYGVRAGLVRPDADDIEVRSIGRRLSPALGFYVVSIAIGLLLPRLAPLLYMAIAVYVLVPIASGYRRTWT